MLYFYMCYKSIYIDLYYNKLYIFNIIYDTLHTTSTCHEHVTMQKNTNSQSISYIRTHDTPPHTNKRIGNTNGLFPGGAGHGIENPAGSCRDGAKTALATDHRRRTEPFGHRGATHANDGLAKRAPLPSTAHRRVRTHTHPHLNIDTHHIRAQPRHTSHHPLTP